MVVQCIYVLPPVITMTVPAAAIGFAIAAALLLAILLWFVVLEPRT